MTVVQYPAPHKSSIRAAEEQHEVPAAMQQTTRLGGKRRLFTVQMRHKLQGYMSAPGEATTRLLAQ